LQQFFEWASQRGYLQDPLPTQAIRPARLPARLPRDLDRLLLQRVLQRAQNHSLRYAALIRLMLECGLRAQELLDLTVQDFQISPEGSLLEVRCGKGSKPRAVAVGDPLSELLQQYLSQERGPCAPTDPLFVSQSRCLAYRGRPLTYDGLRHIVLKLTEPEPGHQTPHQFRHSFATLLLDRGVAPRTHSALAGPHNCRHDDALHPAGQLESSHRPFPRDLESGLGLGIPGCTMASVVSSETDADCSQKEGSPKRDQGSSRTDKPD
jgi:integrase/recombinase XerD